MNLEDFKNAFARLTDLYGEPSKGVFREFDRQFGNLGADVFNQAVDMVIRTFKQYGTSFPSPGFLTEALEEIAKKATPAPTRQEPEDPFDIVAQQVLIRISRLPEEEKLKLLERAAEKVKADLRELPVPPTIKRLAEESYQIRFFCEDHNIKLPGGMV